MTLAEHDEMLKREGRYEAFIEAQQARDAEIAEIEAKDRLAEAPLIEDLHAAGFEVESAWDLVNTAEPYPEALPILLEHLARDYPDRLREGMARAMAVGPDARFAWDRLVQLYKEEPVDTDAKDGLAVALSAIADRKLIDELIGLARDEKMGRSRILMLPKLKRSRAPQARAALEEFCDDPTLGAEARHRLGRK